MVPTPTRSTTYHGATNNNGVTTEPNVEGFNYTVTDANGNTTTGTINVSIIDDGCRWRVRTPTA